MTFLLYKWFISRECPEECRETVASLMFAAARFSDLPELRELRDAFQQKYGTGLDVFVNQKVMFLHRLIGNVLVTHLTCFLLHVLDS